MHPWWENWGWWKMSDDPQEPQPRSYDIGVITPAKRDRLLDAIRRHPTIGADLRAYQLNVGFTPMLIAAACTAPPGSTAAPA